jgi:sortase A
VVIGGHRDTHFRFLQDLRRGDQILLESPGGELVDYFVTATAVVDTSHRGDARLRRRPSHPDHLLPFDAIRLAVRALCDRDSSP